MDNQPNPSTEETALPAPLDEAAPAQPKKSRLLLYAVLGVLLVALLVAAAFLAGRFFNQSQAGGPAMVFSDGTGNMVFGGDSGGPGMVVSGSGPGGVTSSNEIDFQAAPELPEQQPDIAGIFTRREDNSIFIGVGNVGLSISVGPDGNTDSQSTYDGPLTEVVTTKDTLIYRDATAFDPENPSQVEQKVEPGSLDDLSESSMVTVWGRKIGDRIIADVVLYSQPMIFSAPAP